MRVFFLSFPLPHNVCLAYKAKTLLLINSNGGIFHRPIEPTVILRVDNDVLRTIVLANAPISVIKQFLAFLKIQLVKQLAVLCDLVALIRSFLKLK